MNISIFNLILKIIYFLTSIFFLTSNFEELTLYLCSDDFFDMKAFRFVGIKVGWGPILRKKAIFFRKKKIFR